MQTNYPAEQHSTDSTWNQNTGPYTDNRCMIIEDINQPDIERDQLENGTQQTQPNIKER